LLVGGVSVETVDELIGKDRRDAMTALADALAEWLL
jgi:hypothetical protein